LVLLRFFFSSRRRHTRFSRDWSSDVCSSDLTSIEEKGSDVFLLHGDLTVGNVTKPVTFDVEFGGTVTDAYGNFKAGFEVSGKISRKAFGLTWSAVTEAGAVVVSDDVKIQASVQFIKQ